MLIAPAVAFCARPPGQADDFVGRLVDAGYEGIRVETILAGFEQPCTLAVYPPRDVLEGYLAGMGGRFVLDLEMRIHGEGWTIVDTLPDDFPVIHLDSSQVRSIRFVELTVLDLTHNVLEDSISFIVALDLPPVP
ncbi:hypothetical protein JW921_09645 [Candidatus Fermentibacterales bacterium]|nr:hypothetical protein [Candidatus Fermentibacterales bacterium]